MEEGHGTGIGRSRGYVVIQTRIEAMRGLAKENYRHEAVNHSVGEYIKGQAHTNGVESFWSMLKRGHTGIYHKMSKKHLQRYIDEYAGRHNIRPLATMEQIGITLDGMSGKRLKYKELIQ